MKNRHDQNPTPAQTIEVGKFKATVSEVKAGWDETAEIRLNFASESDWLLKVEKGELNNEPSVADKLLAIVEDALRSKGYSLQVMGDDVGSGEKKRVATAIRTMHNYDEEREGVAIRAEKGHSDHEGKFDSHALAQEIANILRAVNAEIGIPTATRTSEIVDDLYTKLDVLQKSADEVLPTSRADKLQKKSPPQKRAAEKSPAELETEMVIAVKSRLPAKYFDTPELRDEAAKTIANGATGKDGVAAWPRTRNESLRATNRDPLMGKIDEVLKPVLKADDSVRGLVDEMVCTEVENRLDERSRRASPSLN